MAEDAALMDFMDLSQCGNASEASQFLQRAGGCVNMAIEQWFSSIDEQRKIQANAVQFKIDPRGQNLEHLDNQVFARIGVIHTMDTLHSDVCSDYDDSCVSDDEVSVDSSIDIDDRHGTRKLARYSCINPFPEKACIEVVDARANASSGADSHGGVDSDAIGTAAMGDRPSPARAVSPRIRSSDAPPDMIALGRCMALAVIMEMLGAHEVLDALCASKTTLSSAGSCLFKLNTLWMPFRPDGTASRDLQRLFSVMAFQDLNVRGIVLHVALNRPLLCTSLPPVLCSAPLARTLRLLSVDIAPSPRTFLDMITGCPLLEYASAGSFLAFAGGAVPNSSVVCKSPHLTTLKAPSELFGESALLSTRVVDFPSLMRVSLTFSLRVGENPKIANEAWLKQMKAVLRTHMIEFHVVDRSGHVFLTTIFSPIWDSTRRHDRPHLRSFLYHCAAVREGNRFERSLRAVADCLPSIERLHFLVNERPSTKMRHDLLHLLSLCRQLREADFPGFPHSAARALLEDHSSELTKALRGRQATGGQAFVAHISDFARISQDGAEELTACRRRHVISYQCGPVKIADNLAHRDWRLFLPESADLEDCISQCSRTGSGCELCPSR